MEIGVQSVVRHHGQLAVTLTDNFLNGPVAIRAQRIMEMHLLYMREAEGNRAVFCPHQPNVDLTPLSTRENLQAVMDRWANVPIEFAFDPNATVSAFADNKPGIVVQGYEHLHAARANGLRIQLTYGVRLTNFPALHYDTDLLGKAIRGGAYIGDDRHSIGLVGHLDIMGRHNDDPWVVAAEWQTLVRTLIK